MARNQGGSLSLKKIFAESEKVTNFAPNFTPVPLYIAPSDRELFTSRKRQVVEQVCHGVYAFRLK